GWSISILTDISAHDWGLLLAATVCNIVAFLAICRGIQLTSVVFGNVSGTIRLAIVSVLGVFLFHEPGGILLGGGVLCACVGTLLIGTTPPVRSSVTGPGDLADLSDSAIGDADGSTGPANSGIDPGDSLSSVFPEKSP
ncbi:MAG: hypothetical protein Q4C47_06230, partial [Planctomycetia bacterium]|nr:hypothetical protein [Planctomycetia bacterium]